MGRKISPNDDGFMRKYNNQVKLWETRDIAKDGQTTESEENKYRPQINLRSKQLALNIEKIEKRVT